MEEILREGLKFAKKIFDEEYSGHDYFHTLRVYKMALHIAEAEHADTFITGLAAILHDVDDRKLSPETHVGKERAVHFMEGHNMGNEQISEICKIIEEVSFAGMDSIVPTSIEGKCVQDADRLDAMGAIGIARSFAYGGSHSREMHNPDISPKMDMSKQEYQVHKSTTINHFYEKLFLLKELMNTDTAKKIAEQREQYMRGFVERFLEEWRGSL